MLLKVTLGKNSCLPYVIGEFTWTAWDYLGEAGIGKAVYFEADDPDAPKYPWVRNCYPACTSTE